jgi:hypothetical protein
LYSSECLYSFLDRMIQWEEGGGQYIVFEGASTRFP